MRPTPVVEEIIPQEKRDEMRREIDDLVAQFLAQGGAIKQVENMSHIPPWKRSAVDCDKETVTLARACRRYDLSQDVFMGMIRDGRIAAWMFRGEVRLARGTLHDLGYKITRSKQR